MTLEERVEFLHQSIESHDRQIGELVERQAKADERQAKADERQIAETARLNRLAETTQLNFSRLAAAMLGLTDHSADHANPIWKA